jgi:hypothetical protein
MHSRLLIAGVAGAAFFVGSLFTTPVVIGDFGSTAAFAKSDKSKGKSKKGGSSKSSSKGKSASASGKSKSKSTDPASNVKSQPETSPVVAVSAKKAAKLEAKAAKIPGLNAKLSALHAMNANINAYIHAGPNSRVGKIAAYARSLVGVEKAETAFTDATEALGIAQETLNNAEIDLNNALADLGGLNPFGDFTYGDFTSETLAGRQTVLQAALETAATQEETDAINAELAAISNLSTNQTAFDDASEAFNEATDNFANAESDLTTAEDDAATALIDAANKTPVDEETRSYVDSQLEERGILDYFRSETTAEAPEVGEEEVGEEVEEAEVEPEVQPVQIN